jgi:hypothetical protein
MKKMIKLSVAAALVSCSVLQAADVMIDGYEAGNIELQFKAMTVLSDYENGFAPSNGSGYLVRLNYETGDFLTEGLSVGVGMYVNGDAGLTEWDERPAPELNKGAYGMVTDVDGQSKALMGELYINYKSEYVNAKLGRQKIKSPLTVIKTSLMPNFHEAYMFDTSVVDGLKITAGHMDKISYGSRAMADWGLIGEKTGTAGVGLGGGGVLFEQAGGDLEQAKFYNVGIAAGLGESTDGRSIVGLTYKGIENLSVDAWVYHSHDIATDYYAELKYAMPVSKGVKVKLNAQYLAQKDAGDSLAGDKDFNMIGAKVSFGSKKMGVYAAFNQSGKKDTDLTNTEGQYFNAWGSDPAYTSSIFSRNAYREDVSAYKVGGHYVIMKGLKLMMSYANYGQSLTGAANKTAFYSRNDAYEIDTVLVYKPTKNLMLKVFNARRLSEYDGVVFDRRMNQYRAIASYTF